MPHNPSFFLKKTYLRNKKIMPFLPRSTKKSSRSGRSTPSRFFPRSFLPRNTNKSSPMSTRIIQNLSQPVGPINKPSNWRNKLFSKPPTLQQQDIAFSSSMVFLKYIMAALFFIFFLINIVYLILSIHDYLQKNNSEEEKRLIKRSITSYIIFSFLNIVLFMIVNSYWQIMSSFRIPLSISITR